MRGVSLWAVVEESRTTQSTALWGVVAGWGEKGFVAVKIHAT